MQNAQHQNLVGFIWNIANKLRGPYRPPQYRRVMLPLIVLRRFDLVLAENKQKVLDEKSAWKTKASLAPRWKKPCRASHQMTASRNCSTPVVLPLKSYWAMRPILLAT